MVQPQSLGRQDDGRGRWVAPPGQDVEDDVARVEFGAERLGTGGLDRIERLRQQLPGLALAGNAYRGIGVPDCIRSGRDAAEQLLT